MDICLHSVASVSMCNTVLILLASEAIVEIVFLTYSECLLERRSNSFKNYELKQPSMSSNWGGHKVKEVQNFLHGDNLFTMVTTVWCSPRQAY